MAISVGSQLGAYEITALIGEGGMGRVFRARDAKLGRDVALKVLPEAWSQDPERLARLEREAQVLASRRVPCRSTRLSGSRSKSHEGSRLRMQRASSIVI